MAKIKPAPHRMTADELADDLTARTMARLATLSPAEREARLAAFRKTVAEARARHARAARTRATRVSSRGR